MKEIDVKSSKPIGHDFRLRKVLAPTGGWNPFIVNRDNRVASFRCQNCGTLQGIGSRDMQSEFEHRCPICGLTMVFNRQPRRLDGRQQAANKRMMLGNNDVRPNPMQELQRLIEQVIAADTSRQKKIEANPDAARRIEAAKKMVEVNRTYG